MGCGKIPACFGMRLTWRYVTEFRSTDNGSLQVNSR
jgi:hypothetical protein